MSKYASELERWTEEGKSENATFLIVVLDTFSYEYYPVFVDADDNVETIKKEYDNKNMQQVMEVVDLNKCVVG